MTYVWQNRNKLLLLLIHVLVFHPYLETRRSITSNDRKFCCSIIYMYTIHYAKLINKAHSLTGKPYNCNKIVSAPSPVRELKILSYLVSQCYPTQNAPLIEPELQINVVSLLISWGSYTNLKFIDLLIYSNMLTNPIVLNRFSSLNQRQESLQRYYECPQHMSENLITKCPNNSLKNKTVSSQQKFSSAFISKLSPNTVLFTSKYKPLLHPN